MSYVSSNTLGDLALINAANNLAGTTTAPGEVSPDPSCFRFQISQIGDVMYVSYSQTLGDLSLIPLKISKDWWEDFEITELSAPGDNLTQASRVPL